MSIFISVKRGVVKKFCMMCGGNIEKFSSFQNIFCLLVAERSDIYCYFSNVFNTVATDDEIRTQQNYFKLNSRSQVAGSE